MSGGVQVTLTPEHQKTFEMLIGVVVQAMGIDGVINNACQAIGPMNAMADPAIVALVNHIAEQTRGAAPQPDVEATEAPENRASRRARAKAAAKSKAEPPAPPAPAKRPAKPAAPKKA